MGLENHLSPLNYHQSLAVRKPGSIDSNETKLEVANNAFNERSHD